MDKNNQNGKAVKDGSLPPPTREMVRDWVKKDLNSAHYLLGLVLTKYPEIVVELSDIIYDNVMTKENGAAINTAVPVGKEADRDGL